MYYKKYIHKAIFLMIALCHFNQMFSQSGSFGNTNIGSGVEMSVIDVQHNFMNGGSGVQPGIIKTSRTSPFGFFSFVGGASYTGASNTAHVDGYVKTYLTTSFTFPIGQNGKLRTASVSASSGGSPSYAAYYGVNPTTNGYSSASIGAGVTGVSTSEYWDISGTTPAKITLTWDANSGVQNTSNVKIVGWNGTQWIDIPATVVSGGTTSSGSIMTNSSIIPDTYTVYTLAGLNATISFTGTGPGVSSGSPTVSAMTNENKSGNAGTELVPTGGTAPYTYSNGATDPNCIAPSGANPLPVSSNLTVNANGSYTYIAPSTPGLYYYCVKVCDSSTPTPICKIATYTLTVTNAVGSGTIDCAKTQFIPAPVVGNAGQAVLSVIVNVTTIGSFPLTISGSGMSLANGVSSVNATTTGSQTFYIPLRYDGGTLGTLNFTVGTAGTCFADLTLTTAKKKVETDIWTLDNCTLKVSAPILK
jgi:hypothetical protein